MKMLRPQKQISPVPLESVLTILYRQPGTTLPQLCQRKEAEFFFLLLFMLTKLNMKALKLNLISHTNVTIPEFLPW